MKQKKSKTMKRKPKTVKFDDVDYATDIDVLTIMSRSLR